MDTPYDRSDLYILLEFSPSGWHWILAENGDNEHIENGKGETIQIAAADACRAFDKACGIPATA